ncbi:MAG TPA: oxygenase MpaB family protein [Nocardioidaceae bacterium]|nr:oxygenase MpaB family protein [Nocardioidaceae bacterium]
MSVTHTEPTRPPRPQPLGPDSLTWRYLGDWRYMLTATRWGALQSLDPAFGAGAVQHSVIFKDPVDRLMRSMPPIIGVVYDGHEATATARWVRDQHPEIKGIDQNGKAYHALNPETFFWAHATFVDCLVTMVDTFDHRMSDEEKEQLYAESKRWWAMYGMTDRVVPPDWAAFRVYFDDYCANVLQVTEGFTRALDIAGDTKGIAQTSFPPLLFKLVGPHVVRLSNLLMVGLLPTVVREELGYEWSAGDARRLRALAWLVRTTWPLVPRRLRYMTRARQAFDRTGEWPRARRR